jgi:regulator of cell morphogenesis and NO signaling
MNMTTATLSTPEELKQVLIRYDVTCRHELLYSFEELTRLGVDADFVFALLEVFQDTNAIERKAFDKFRLETVIDYIRKTHEYYLQRKLLEIEQSIHLLLRAYPEAHPLLIILHDFYSSYRRHLTNHIEVEETQLLPYILHLQKVEDGKASFQAYPGSYSLSRFLVHHQDTEKDLEEVRLAMQRYSPPPTNATPYRILLSQLEVLERDLAVHALIEEEVLLPRALAIERRWGR